MVPEDRRALKILRHRPNDVDKQREKEFEDMPDGIYMGIPQKPLDVVRSYLVLQPTQTCRLPAQTGNPTHCFPRT